MHGFPALFSGSSVMRSKWFMRQKYTQAGSEVNSGRGGRGSMPIQKCISDTAAHVREKGLAGRSPGP